jgi:hypothetical protein
LRFVLDKLCDILSNTPVTRNYKADLEDAIHQLILMASEREELEIKIAKQKKRVAALHELVQTDEGSAALTGLVEGITDACRVVFRAAERPLFPAEVRDRVQALGLPPQDNLLASIHTTIRRMKEAGEIKEISKVVQSGGMGAAYMWVNEARSMNALADTVRGLAVPPDLAGPKAPRPPQSRLAKQLEAERGKK